MAIFRVTVATKARLVPHYRRNLICSQRLIAFKKMALSFL